MLYFFFHQIIETENTSEAQLFEIVGNNGDSSGHFVDPAKHCSSTSLYSLVISILADDWSKLSIKIEPVQWWRQFRRTHESGSRTVWSVGIDKNRMRGRLNRRWNWEQAMVLYNRNVEWKKVTWVKKPLPLPVYKVKVVEVSIKKKRRDWLNIQKLCTIFY